MALAMQPHSSRRAYFGFLAHGFATAHDIVEREFDEDENYKPVTAEPLDWHLGRHWPILATD